jgi:hypothetical protein
MNMADKDLGEHDLDLFFAAARDRAPLPSGTLMARVLDAAEAEARPAMRDLPMPAPVRRGMIASLMSAIGGWAGVGGLATAVGAGVWIGVAGLADPVTVTGDLFGPAPLTVELMPGADSFTVAGGTGW